MAPAFEKRQLDYLSLKNGKGVELTMEEAAQVGSNQIVTDLISTSAAWLLASLHLKTILCPTVRLAATQAINCPASRQGYHPAKRPARFGRIVSGLFPDLKENFLQDVIRFGLFVHDPRDNRFQRFAVALVKFAQGLLLPIGNRCHQRFVGGIGESDGIDQRLDHKRQNFSQLRFCD
jgi:hypothetical protein